MKLSTILNKLPCVALRIKLEYGFICPFVYSFAQYFLNMHFPPKDVLVAHLVPPAGAAHYLPITREEKAHSLLQTQT